MASKIKTHLDELEEYDYQLIAIHTSLEDYRLAYFINQRLPVNLKKCEKELHVRVKQGETHFARFHFEDQENLILWDLIENKNSIILQENDVINDLFSDTSDNFSSSTYLLPEYKKVNFFLKIESEEAQLEISEFVSKINTIDKITMAYAVDKDKIKSKNNLIF